MSFGVIEQIWSVTYLLQQCQSNYPAFDKYFLLIAHALP